MDDCITEMESIHQRHISVFIFIAATFTMAMADSSKVSIQSRVGKENVHTCHGVLFRHKKNKTPVILAPHKELGAIT